MKVLRFSGLVIALSLLYIFPVNSQSRKEKLCQTVVFDSSVFQNPLIKRSYIDQFGKQVVEISVPGVLPGKPHVTTVIPADNAKILPHAPAYDWSFGCSATSAAMMAGYYDNNGYPEMYTGPANNGIAPMDNSIWGQATINGEVRSLCPLSATRSGLDGRLIKGHVDDFWIHAGNNSPDPYIGNWTAHPYGDCTGDFMKTNQSEFGNSDGSTIYVYYVDGSPFTGYDGSDGQYGLSLFFESRGYSVLSYFNQYIMGYNGLSQGFTFDEFKSQIDLGHPVLIQLSGHTVLGIGYDESSQKVYLHNTWDYNLQEMIWGDLYSGLQHYGVSVIELLPVNSPILTVTPNFQNVTWEEGTSLFSVISNRTWNVSESSEWLSLAQNSGTGNGYFTVLFNENPVATDRSAQITISASTTDDDQIVQGNKSVEPLIWEQFPGPNLPVGWQVSGIGASNWAISNASVAGSKPPLLKFNWEPQIIGLSRMMTNIVNTNGMTSLILSFKHFVNRYEASFLVGVASSGDGGETWQTVWSQNITENLGPESKTLQISNETVGSSQFRLCFYFEGNTWNIWDWSIDNVSLEVYDDTETITITQQANPSITQNLSINGGWSGISLFVEPSVSNVAEMMSPLGSNFVMIKDLTKYYYPATGVNTLVNWSSSSGYIIKLEQGATLPVSGVVPETKTLELNNGWNLIPVLSNSQINTTSLFSSISNKIMVVMDVAGNGIYWPQMNINTLPLLLPGKSYFVRLNSPGSITFP